MKTAYHSVSAIIAVGIFIGSATVQGEDYLYETNNGTITITVYTGPGGAVIIPGEVYGLPVRTIGLEAFSFCVNLISVTIPDSVTCIRGGHTIGAFTGCSNVTTVSIGKSVTDIGAYAFAECGSLTTIKIPASVTSIGPMAFADCSSLTAITVDENNPVYSNVGAVLFNQAQTTLTQYAVGKAGDYIIPNSVIGIDFMAFSGCTSLTSITIPNSVTSIGPMAFYNCTSLTNITISNGVTSIGGEAFASCTGLSGSYFEGNAPALGGDVFYQTTKNTVYYLPGTIGWGTTFGGRPTAPWALPYPLILTTTPNFGIRNNKFGFRISWATNSSVVVEAATELANPVWSPVSMNTLVGGWSDFRDAEWTNHPARFYRVRQE
jgi:hypothetical protein